MRAVRALSTNTGPEPEGHEAEWCVYDTGHGDYLYRRVH